MFWLTLFFFLVEIVVGYVTNSMALVADSFHMLSDVAALVVAFLSVKVRQAQNLVLCMKIKCFANSLTLPFSWPLSALNLHAKLIIAFLPKYILISLSW
jgi:hypothetical protein